ncbi:MAG: addiction module antitoxin [Acidobacteriota bacterium]|nr:addiction module antitoxin [Acidobacteriota bacterium]MDH3523902.1 addiction module antitoxin [Acidobacteriota bacterium]
MSRKLTISIDDAVYEGLYRRIGPRKIGRFLESLARPHVIDEELEGAYAAMAADEVREAEAEEWVENLVADVGDEPR